MRLYYCKVEMNQSIVFGGIQKRWHQYYKSITVHHSKKHSKQQVNTNDEINFVKVQLIQVSKSYKLALQVIQVPSKVSGQNT